MNLAKISANGQITVPVAIRKAQAAFTGAAETMEMDHPKCMTVAQFFESEGIEE